MFLIAYLRIIFCVNGPPVCWFRVVADPVNFFCAEAAWCEATQPRSGLAFGGLDYERGTRVAGEPRFCGD